MADRWHVKWLGQGPESWNERRKRVSFKPDLSGVIFSEAISRSDETPSAYPQYNLNKANLNGADLSGVILSGSRFRFADLTDARLDRSNFMGANFFGAKLQGTSAQNTNFRGAKFRRADLSHADFRESNLENTIFLDSNLSAEQAASFGSFDGVVLPEGLSLPPNWPRDHIPRETLIDEVLESYERLRAYDFELRDKAPDTWTITSTTYSKRHEETVQRSILTEADKAVFDVYYGTNRNLEYADQKLSGYGSARADSLDYGICEVSVPKSHRVGSVGSPIWKRLFREDDRLSMSILIQLNRELFWSHVQKTMLQKARNMKPTLFVHGFNNSFEEAVIRAAQIGFDLGLGGGISLFSWPSAGKLSRYVADEAAMEASKYLLADFIEGFTEQCGLNSLNIIAHSMGCRCLLLAMEVLAARNSAALPKIGHIVLAAADVDQGIMKKLGAHAVQNSSRTTSYSSTEDKAVEVSSWLHSFPRVGVCPPVYVMDGMDTILVNNTDLTMIGHGYVASSGRVLSDIHQLLAFDAHPRDRFTIDAVGTGTGAHWKLKD